MAESGIGSEIVKGIFGVVVALITAGVAFKVGQASSSPATTVPPAAEAPQPGRPVPEPQAATSGETALEAALRRAHEAEARAARIDSWVSAVTVPEDLAAGECATRISKKLKAEGWAISMPTPEMVVYRSAVAKGRIWCWPTVVYTDTVSDEQQYERNKDVNALVAAAVAGN